MRRRHQRQPSYRLRGLVACFALTATALAPGCLVSFEGYGAREIGGGAGEETNGGTPGGGNGGAASEAGEGVVGGSDAGAGDGGQPEMGGSAGDGGKPGGGGGAAGSVSGGGSSGTSGSAGSGGQSPIACPVNLEGPPMIEVPKPGGGFYCMDRTEVPAQDYAAFLTAEPSTEGQSPACSWNASYEPDTTSACASPSGAYEPTLRPRSPVSCVDWCDAKRYCEWAGKRLCGAIAGGPNPPSKFADAASSQWYRACSGAGAQQFPYGNSYEPTACTGLDNSGVHPSSVATAVACEGGYPGLFDMSGNVSEWEDSCSGSAGSSDNCLIRGGNILQAERTAPSILCNSSKLDAATATPATAKRNARDELIGFRCCLDP